MLAYKDGERVRLVHTRASLTWPPPSRSSLSALLDGEVAIYDQKLRSRFDCCAVAGRRERARPGRLHRHREIPRTDREVLRGELLALRVTTLAETAREVTNASTTR
jgi:hypothetical protein